MLFQFPCAGGNACKIRALSTTVAAVSPPSLESSGPLALAFFMLPGLSPGQLRGKCKAIPETEQGGEYETCSTKADLPVAPRQEAFSWVRRVSTSGLPQ